MDNSTKADIGDYLKVFACTAVMLQSILALILKISLTHNEQTGIGFTYNLVKFTAPAFIFGILYTTIRTHPHATLKDYPTYMRGQWSALFVPTICWTSIYLLLMPQLQQHNHFHNFINFCWQFINGNAAPHMWYNTMMLQFIILMPIFWYISRYVKNSNRRCWLIITVSTVIYFLWIDLYDKQIFHGPQMPSWYLFDRLFLSFIIYAVLGTLAWNFHKQLGHFLLKFWWSLIIIWAAVYYLINHELFSFDFPVNLYNAPYYKPSMTVYCLVIIGLIATLAFYQIKRQQIRSLKLFHWLAAYAYKAFLSHVFWLELAWLIFGKQLLKDSNPLVTIIVLYILTWLLSFASAYDLHMIWSKIKTRLLA